MTNQKYEILRGAGKILTTSGPKGLTINSLSDEVHLTVNEISQQFENEEAIITALLCYMEQEMDSRFSEVVDAEQSPQEKLTAFFRSQFSFSREHPYMVMAMFSDDLNEKTHPVHQNILRIRAVLMLH